MKHKIGERIMKIKTLILAGILGTAMAAQGAAVTLSGLSQSGGEFQWPSATLLGGHENVSLATQVGLQTGRSYGQTFTIVENDTIDLITFSFMDFSTAGGDFTVEFYKVASVSTGDTSTGPVDSGTFSAADISALGFSTGDHGTLVLDVTDTAVTAGEVYAWKVTGLGNRVFNTQNSASVYAGGQSFGTQTGTRDYFVAAYSFPTDLQVQITTDSAGTLHQAGWYLVDGDRGLASISKTVSSITITVAASYGRNSTDGANYPEVDHTDGDLDNLLSGGRAVNNAANDITLTLAGLADGPYSITTYLHECWNPATGFDFDVTRTDANGTDVLVHNDLAVSYGASVDTATLSAPVTTFTVSGGNDVILTFDPEAAEFGPSDQLFLNGFELSRRPSGTVIIIR